MSASRTRASLWITLAAAVAFALTLRLGWWQLSRAHAREAIQAATEAQAALPALEQSVLFQDAATQWIHRRVVLRGTWDAAHTVYLDNRQMAGRPGFYVLTPLKLAGSPRAVLVQRGWIARDFQQRERLAPVATPQGEVQLTGQIAPPPARLYEFDGAASGPIRQNLDLTAFRNETGLALLDLSVVQLGGPSEGLLREWPQAATGAERNYGYAFQWWAMSALIAILYVWFQFIVPARKARHAR